MSRSSIEWTEMTWNPTTGCSKVSQGCKFCYAEIMSRRLKLMGIDKYKDDFEVRIHPDELATPYTWKKSRIVFVNSMSDLFHRQIPKAFINDVFDVMGDNPQHVFQILTKRPDRLIQLNDNLNWTHNIWMGVSVENQMCKNRIRLLANTSARTKFLSIEPLLEALGELDLTNIDWVIVGGESGRNPRPMKEEWVLDIQRQCKEQEVKFFFKQWGGKNKKRNGRILNGKTFDEMPEIDLQHCV